MLVIEHKLLPSKMHAMRTCCRRSKTKKPSLEPSLETKKTLEPNN